MSLDITVTNKTTHVPVETAAHEVTLSDLSVVEVNLHRAEIKLLERSGNDLIVIADDGVSIVVHNFFVDRQDGVHNDLVLQDDGSLWLTDLSGLSAPVDTALGTAADGGTLANGGDATMTPIDSIEPLLDTTAQVAASVPATADVPAAADMPATADAPAAADVPVATDAPTAAESFLNWAPPIFGAGLVAAILSGGGSASATPAAPTVGAITPNGDGTLTVSGSAEPGSTVTVTFPDSSTGTATADANGNYSVQSQTPQTSGEVTATATDAAHNISNPATGQYTDTTPPSHATLTVSIDPITGDNTINASEAAGQVTVTGSVKGDGEWTAGDAVTLSVDGGATSIGSGTLDADGNYSISVAGSALTGAGDGTDALTATVAAHDTTGNTGNVAGAQTYAVDTTPPDASEISAVGASSGDDSISGAFDADATLTSGFLDATGASISGSPSIDSSGGAFEGNIAAPSGAYTLVLAATDSAGNASTTYMPLQGGSLLTYDMGGPNAQNGKDLLVFKVNAQDNLGGNPADITLTHFTVGDTAATVGADRIDLSHLLVGYDASSNINDFVTATSDGVSTMLTIDRDGAGTAYTPGLEITLQDVTVTSTGGQTVADLLLQNHQLIVQST